MHEVESVYPELVKVGATRVEQSVVQVEEGYGKGQKTRVPELCPDGDGEGKEVGACQSRQVSQSFIKVHKALMCGVEWSGCAIGN